MYIYTAHFEVNYYNVIQHEVRVTHSVHSQITKLTAVETLCISDYKSKIIVSNNLSVVKYSVCKYIIISSKEKL